MRVQIRVIIESDRRAEPVVQEVASWARSELSPGALGMTLVEAKALLSAVQERLCTEQVNEFLASQRPCPRCGGLRSHKGHHALVYRTVFGIVKLNSGGGGRLHIASVVNGRFAGLGP